MDWANLLILVSGLALRIGIPLVATVLVLIWLNRLDQRWQKEAEKEQARLQVLGKLPANARCWETNHCSEASKARCPAFKKQDAPCWQVFRRSNGLMKEKCLGCSVFNEAPVPVVVN